MDEVSNIIKESIENTIGGNGYAHPKVSQWTNAVVESCLASLTKLQKPFKYIGKSMWKKYLRKKINLRHTVRWDGYEQNGEYQNNDYHGMKAHTLEVHNHLSLKSYMLGTIT